MNDDDDDDDPVRIQSKGCRKKISTATEKHKKKIEIDTAAGAKPQKI